jgi:hypothetical protein
MTRAKGRKELRMATREEDFDFSQGSSRASVMAAKAQGAEVGAKYAPGTEPVMQTPPDDVLRVMSDASQHGHPGDPHFEDSDIANLQEAVLALASGDLGAARRALSGHPDHAIHRRQPDEPANPVPDPEQFEKVEEATVEREEELAGALRASAEPPPSAISTAQESDRDVVQKGIEAAKAGSGKRPAKSASKDEWVSYRKSQGFSDDELEGKTRDELARMRKKPTS